MEQNNNPLNGSIFLLGIVVLIVLFVIKFFNISYPISITNQPISELSVVGSGKVDVVPDTANVKKWLGEQKRKC